MDARESTLSEFSASATYFFMEKEERKTTMEEESTEGH